MRSDLLCQTAVRKGMVCNLMKFVSQKYPTENTLSKTGVRAVVCRTETAPLERSWMSGQSVPSASLQVPQTMKRVSKSPLQSQTGASKGPSPQRGLLLRWAALGEMLQVKGKKIEPGFSVVPSSRTRGNRHTTKYRKFCLNIMPARLVKLEEVPRVAVGSLPWTCTNPGGTGL